MNIHGAAQLLAEALEERPSEMNEPADVAELPKWAHDYLCGLEIAAAALVPLLKPPAPPGRSCSKRGCGGTMSSYPNLSSRLVRCAECGAVENVPV